MTLARFLTAPTVARAGCALLVVALGLTALTQADAARDRFATWRAWEGPADPSSWPPPTSTSPLLQAAHGVSNLAAYAGFALAVAGGLAPGAEAARRRSTIVALAFFALAFAFPLALRLGGVRLHPASDAGALVAIAFPMAAIVALAWPARGARALALAGAAFVVLRAPLMARASDALVHATGAPESAPDALALAPWPLAATALGTLLLAAAFLVAARRGKEARPSVETPSPA